MIDDRDIWRAAKLLVDRYGDRAAAEVAKRADDMLSQGDVAGAATWQRIQECAHHFEIE